MIYSTSELQQKQKHILDEAEKSPIYIRRKGILFLVQVVHDDKKVRTTLPITQTQLDKALAVTPKEDLDW